MKKIVSIMLLVIMVFTMTIQTFCLPNDLALYGIKPLVIQSENFNLIYGDHGEDTLYLNLSTLKFGKYLHKDGYGLPQEDIEWMVLAKGDGKALLVSRDILFKNAYNYSGNKCSFDNSSIRDALNNSFYEKAFSNSEKKHILNYTPTNSKIFILSEYELKLYMGLNVTPKYNDSFIKEKPHKGMFTYGSHKYAQVNKYLGDIDESDKGTYNESYLVRTDSESNKAKKVYNGKISKIDLNIEEGVRPAMWVSYSQVGQDKYDEVASAAYDFAFGKIFGAMFGPFGLVGDLISDSLSPDSWYDDINEAYIGYSLTGWSADKYYKNGEVVKNDWVKWDSEWYHINNEGLVDKNKWIINNNDSYYVNEKGKMCKNQWIENKYYVDKNGKMLKNTTTPDGEKVDKEGMRIDSDNFNYTLNLEFDIKKEKNRYYLIIKNEKNGSDAKKLGLSNGDKLILGGDSFDITSEITEVFKDNTGEESLVKEVAIRKFTEFINKLDYTSITFQTKDNKKIKLTKEEIIDKIK